MIPESINTFLENPTIKVELELTDQATTRIIVMALVIIVIGFSVAFIYSKIKS